MADIKKPPRLRVGSAPKPEEVTGIIDEPNKRWVDITVKASPEYRKQVKILAARHGLPLNELFKRAIAMYVKEYGLGEDLDL